MAGACVEFHQPGGGIVPAQRQTRLHPNLEEKRLRIDGIEPSGIERRTYEPVMGVLRGLSGVDGNPVKGFRERRPCFALSVYEQLIQWSTNGECAFGNGGRKEHSPIEPNRFPARHGKTAIEDGRRFSGNSAKRQRRPRIQKNRFRQRINASMAKNDRRRFGFGRFKKGPEHRL